MLHVLLSVGFAIFGEVLCGGIIHDRIIRLGRSIITVGVTGLLLDCYGHRTGVKTSTLQGLD